MQVDFAKHVMGDEFDIRIDLAHKEVAKCQTRDKILEKLIEEQKISPIESLNLIV